MTSEQDSQQGHCYFCGGKAAEGGSITVQLNEGEPKREICPECFRNWPPEGVADE